MSSEWFAVQRLREGVFLVAEPMHVNSYLVVGSRIAVLVDSGMGIRRIRPVVEGITDRPVLVVNTHHHFDHVGGNHEFDEIAVHEDGVAAHRAGPPDHWLPAYLLGVEDTWASYAEFAALDREWFHLLGPEQCMRPLPAEFDPARWSVRPAEPTRLLTGGDEIDLGDRRLHVLHTPGHSPDSVCVLDERERLLFAGDTVTTGPLYAHLPGAHLADYAATARHLSGEVGPAVDELLVAHGPRYRAYPDLLGRVADTIDQVLAHRVPLAETRDCFLDAARSATVGDVSLVVPAGHTAPPTAA